MQFLQSIIHHPHIPYFFIASIYILVIYLYFSNEQVMNIFSGICIQATTAHWRQIDHGRDVNASLPNSPPSLLCERWMNECKQTQKGSQHLSSCRTNMELFRLLLMDLRKHTSMMAIHVLKIQLEQSLQTISMMMSSCKKTAVNTYDSFKKYCFVLLYCLI